MVFCLRVSLIYWMDLFEVLEIFLVIADIEYIYINIKRITTHLLEIFSEIEYNLLVF